MVYHHPVSSMPTKDLQRRLAGFQEAQKIDAKDTDIVRRKAFLQYGQESIDIISEELARREKQDAG